MIFSAALGLGVLILGHMAGPVLLRLSWAHRYPRAALTLWLAVLAGALVSVVGLVARLLLVPPGIGHWIVEQLDRCLPVHGHPGSALALVLGVASMTATAVAVRGAWRRLRSTFAAQRWHREMLEFVVRIPGDLDDVCVVDHPVPVAYCMPARKRPIVLSSGALERLTPGQLAAVLTHERAHLRGRHHLIIAAIDALAGVAPWAGTLRSARTEVPALLELAADDAAVARHGRRAVAGALRRIAVTPCPAGALAAAPSGSKELAHRLARIESGGSATTRGRVVAWMGALTTTAVPFVIVAGWVASLSIDC